MTVAGVVNIPITGQTTSYAAGDDGDMQRGVSWPNPRFSTNTDTTITDNFTGFVWTSDGNAPGPVECNPAVTKTWQEALDYVSCLNANSYLGYNDWRLPNKRELRSLIDYSQADTSILLNTQGFSNVQNIYWSSTTLASYPNMAWFVPMNHGGMDCYGKINSLHVWPVRSGQAVYTASGALPATGQMTCYDATGNVIVCAGTGQDGDLQKGITWPIPRFTTNEDTTVTDNLTGLVWTSSESAPGPAACATYFLYSYEFTTWQGALDYVSCLNANSYLGHNDWRLPNINERESMIDDGEPNPTTEFWWSSTTVAGDTSRAWVVFMYEGRVWGPEKSFIGFPRPVRAGR